MPDDLSFQLPNLSERIFRENGYAAALPNFEHRQEQEKMAYYCAQTFAGEGSLLFEAGTGVGKSLAYLIPGIVAAVRMKRPLVVSTHTIALQRQIIEKDLPRARLLFSSCEELSDCADFKDSLLLGRGNYLCTHRLKRALSEKKDLFDTDESLELDRIANWALVTRTGLLEELNPPPNPEVWNWVSADASSCNSRNCNDGTCFYQNARRAVTSADIIVVNHSLFFSLIASGGAVESGRGILFANDMLVLDEAHLLPDVASDCFGIGISSGGIARELRRLYDPRKKRGLITREGMAEHWDKKLVSNAIETSGKFFARIKKDYLSMRDTVRLSSPNWETSELVGELDSIVKLLATFAQNAKTESLAAEINDHKRKISAMKNSIEECLFLSDTESVYWLERSGREGQSVELRSAPLDIAPILRRILFSGSAPAILTSATLATDMSGSMEDFSERIGAEGAEKYAVKSPFDYDKNMRTLLFCELPEPDKDSKRQDSSALAKKISELVSEIQGGSLVLFTSYSDMNSCAAILRESDVLKKRKILVQGEIARGEIVRAFSDAGNAILLGTDTFWTGIDVPGDALSQVIVARLPFDNPNHPLLAARMERAENLGENPFMKILLPNAVIKFRQGIGRLIRGKKDSGRIAVLDSRIISKSYGRRFVDAIPTSQISRVK